MSTTFGVQITNYPITVEVARRAGIANGKVEFRITNMLMMLLPDETPVVPMDNTSQGIHTVGDTKKVFKEQGQ